MPRWGEIRCALAVLVWASAACAQEITLPPVTTVTDWEYTNNGTAEWPTIYPDCGLPSQSPVPLDRYKSLWLTASLMEGSDLTAELFDYTEPTDATFVNNGRVGVLVLNYPDPDTGPRIVSYINGEVDTTSYLQRVNFHWPSEHVIDNKRYELEAQMVHIDDSGYIRILSYLYDYCGHLRDGIDLLGETAMTITEAGESATLPGFVPQSIMPYGIFSSVRMCDYFVYTGSLTRPPCTPDVLWYVYSQPQCVSVDEMRMTWLDSNGDTYHNNTRPLQPIGERMVSYKPCDNV